MLSLGLSSAEPGSRSFLASSSSPLGCESFLIVAPFGFLLQEELSASERPAVGTKQWEALGRVATSRAHLNSSVGASPTPRPRCSSSLALDWSLALLGLFLEYQLCSSSSESDVRRIGPHQFGPSSSSKSEFRTANLARLIGGDKEL